MKKITLIAVALILTACTGGAAVAAAKVIGIEIAKQVAGEAIARKIEPRATEFVSESVLPSVANAIEIYCRKTPIAAREAARAQINQNRQNKIIVACPPTSAPSVAENKGVCWQCIFTDSIRRELAEIDPSVLQVAAAPPTAAVQNLVDRYCRATSFTSRGQFASVLRQSLPPQHSIRIDCVGNGGLGFLPQLF